MNVFIRTRQSAVVFGLLTGLFLLFMPSSDASATHDRRLSYEERYLNHFCKVYANRGFFPDYCDATDPGPEPDEPTVEIDADQLLVPVGVTTTLFWESDDADTCEASGGWSGTKALEGSEVVTINATTTYTLTCTGEGGEATESVVVAAEVIEEPEPETPTLEIDADELLVPAGSTTTLFWESEHADSCEASDGWSGTKATEGSEIVTVNATTTYELTCMGEGGEVTETVTVAALLPDEPGEATLAFAAEPAIVNIGSTTILSWLAEGVDTCVASGDWTGEKALSGTEEIVITESSSFTLSCSDEDSNVSKGVAVTVFEPGPDPEPTTDHVLITEFLYDVVSGGAQGAETTNEWVEIYNPTGSPVDLMNWEIGDGSSNDVISTESLMLAPGAYLVIANATNTADFWDFSEVTVVYLENAITSGGLANTGDEVRLFDETLAEVDAVSYGNNTDALDPAVTGGSNGNSIERTDHSVDTDTAADWGENETPTPGF